MKIFFYFAAIIDCVIVLYFYRLITMKIFCILTILMGLVLGEDNILSLSQGKIKGSILKSRNGREFKAFQGIPYAKSPVGDLRLKVISY